MASIGHVAVGLAAARRSAEASRSASLQARVAAILGWSALSLLPDIDVVGFMRGVPYGAEWGHRGATHSLTMAVVGGVVVGLGARVLRVRRPLRITLLAVIVLASHGLLDTLTDGGLGAALLWPFSLHRFFAPWQPIPVAPIGPAFFTLDGAMIAATELVLFLPLWLYAFRIRQRAAVIAVWLVAVWLLTSTDPIRERLVDRVYPDQTRFAAGYSEDFFKTIVRGDREDAVRGRLGEPLFDSVFYLPKGYNMESIMAGQVPPGCFGVGVKDAVVHDTHDPDVCRSRGLTEGMSRAEMVRILGTPAGSCAQYTDGANNGHFRLRMVCFVNGTVERIFRQRT